jgi:hypothetical protein
MMSFSGNNVCYETISDLLQLTETSIYIFCESLLGAPSSFSEPHGPGYNEVLLPVRSGPFCILVR